MSLTPRRFDVFCRVVDNFGDAGVALRLSRQLAQEHAGDVTLWIDDTATLARLIAVPVVRDGDHHEGVRVRMLAALEGSVESADVVVETFGCGLPQPYLDAMARMPRPPVWIVLEYLSAESWIDGAHALPSPHPVRALPRWFLFPGFTPRSGGLLRERGVIERCRRAKHDAHARDEAWTSLGFPPPPSGSLVVSLFCYPNAALASLLDAWRRSPRPVACIVPEGVATSEIDVMMGRRIGEGMLATTEALTIAVAPFVAQDAFDLRLATSDLCFVRGEDSFARAQWAQTPFVWHAYPQAERAHMAKLCAFIDRYVQALDAGVAATLRAFWVAFNEGDGAAAAHAWPSLQQALDPLQRHATAWAHELARQQDLASHLVEFASDQL